MRLNLKVVIFLGGSILVLAPALISGMFFASSLQQRVETVNINRLRALGELASDQMARRMHTLWRDVDGMARTADLSSPDELRGRFSFLAQLDPRYSWIGAAAVDGKVVAAVNGLLEGQSVAERPWFRRGLNGPSASDVHDAKLLEKLLPATPEPRRFVDFSAPIKNTHGDVTGVIGAHFDWNWVRENIGSLATPGVDILLLSRDRTVLYGPSDLQGKVLSVGSAIAAGQATSIALDEHWPDGHQYVSAVVPSVQFQDMPSFGWSLIVRARADEVFGPVRALLRSFWTILGIGALCTLTLLYLFAQWIAVPLNRLVGSADAFANGRASVPVYEETRYEEARDLAAALVRLQTQSMRPYQKRTAKVASADSKKLSIKEES
ncbi:cache domain-containing protein [Microvirga puerhi]|uniref:Cache domain-containing protein n=1 Tax=Microvirga puerhi TaxID=2876078 RepID=A0ABS7VKL1_9HYPH|nr:cache domain-containing protein [Microvirga puerhi]MBZ6076034.1 cache domain-containing protein [Microvirga puerhi]